MSEATALGLLPRDPIQEVVASSILSGLGQVAEVSAGLAWGLHRLSLGQAVVRAAALGSDGFAVPVYAGAGQWGLAPEALAAWWFRCDLNEAQRDLFMSWGALPTAAWPLHLPSHWTHLVRAVAVDDGEAGVRWQWCVLPRDRVDAQPSNLGMGLEPVQVWTVTADVCLWDALELPPSVANELWRDTLLADQRAVMTLAARGLLQAEREALDHVRQRRQGGCVLHEHAAVQARVGQMLAARQSLERTIQAWDRPLACRDLPGLMKDRLDVHDRCLVLTDEALQLMGALGYLRDGAVARAWRDQRALRQMAGGVFDVHRLVALCREACGEVTA